MKVHQDIEGIQIENRAEAFPYVFGVKNCYIGLIIRILTSTIFILSAYGKLSEYSISSLSLSQLFGMPYAITEVVIFFWLIFEVVLAFLVWLRHLLLIVLAVPITLLGVAFFSYWRGIECGCFGSLPFFSQLSLGAHLLLLVGILLGLYYLTITPKVEKATPQAKDGQTATIPETPSWTGLAAIVMMSSAFLSLPFTSSDSRASNHLPNDTVDRPAVEAVIANHSAVLIDARPDFQYELGHLPGAINIPYDNDDLVEFVNKHSLKNQTLIVYCSSAHCNAAELLAEKLHRLGCKMVRVYPDGWEEWVRHHPNHPPN